MGFVESLPLIQRNQDEDIQRWVYIPERDQVVFWPWTEATHYKKLYELGYDRNHPWFGGYAIPSTGEMSMSEGNHNMADWVENRVRPELPQATSSWKVSAELCPVCKHELSYVDHDPMCSNCGWIPIGQEDNFDSEEYLHERDFHDYRHDPGGPPLYLGKVAHIVNLPDEFKSHNDYEDGRRTFMYLAPNDTLYLAPNNAYHNDIQYWMHQNIPTMYAQLFDHYDDMNFDRDKVCLGLLQRNWEDHALEAHIYSPEGMERLPSHIMTELEHYFGESVHQVDWQYPVDWTQIHGDPYGMDDYDETQQWPEGWDKDEGLWPSSSVGTQGWVYDPSTDQFYTGNTYHAPLVYNNNLQDRKDELVYGWFNRTFGGHDRVRLYSDNYNSHATPEQEARGLQLAQEYFYKNSGVIATWIRTAADVNALAAKAYDQIMSRPDVMKIYEMADMYEKEFQGVKEVIEKHHEDRFEPSAKNFQKILPDNPDPEKQTPEGTRFLGLHNAHVLATAIQAAVSRIRNQYPAAYKLMPNVVKTLKQQAQNDNTTMTQAQAQHLADIYGQAGVLLTELRQQNKVPEGMDVNQMSFEEIEQWLYDYRNQNTPGKYMTNDIVYDLGNGWHIVQIKDDEDLATEGELMGHCVGGYCNMVHSGHSLIYSLRDPKNDPHATIEIEGQGRGAVAPLAPAAPGAYSEGGADPWQVVQIQGKQNNPPIPQYKDMIRQWFISLQDQGVQFQPQQNDDFVEYIQDADELMSWYKENYPQWKEQQSQPQDVNRDEYGLPRGTTDNKFEFYWSTVVDYCVDNVLKNHRYRHWETFYPSDLVDALKAGLEYEPLPDQQKRDLVEQAENELMNAENEFEEQNIDHYWESANYIYQQDHPGEELDQDSEEWQELWDQVRDENYKEYFGDANDFVHMLAKALTGQGAFGAQARVIYV